MTNRRAKVIAIEGRDGVGKTTQVAATYRALVDRGARVVPFKFPIRGTITGDAIYSMLDTGAATRWPSLFQTLHTVNKFIPQLVCIPYVSLCCDFILFDRCNLSCVVYGAASGSSSVITDIAGCVLDEPDAIVVLDGDCKRDDASSGDSYERDVDFQERIRQLYLSEAARRSNCVIVSSDGDERAVGARILLALEKMGAL